MLYYLKSISFLSLVSFFICNIALLKLDAHIIAYPSIAFLFVLVHVLSHWSNEQKNQIESNKKIELNMTQSVPNQRLLNELNMARGVQEGLMSVESPDIPGFQISKKYTPADRVGGDFYMFVSQDFNNIYTQEKNKGILEYRDQQHRYLGVGIGDVAGHGVSSALVMALSSGLLSELGRQYQSPGKILYHANKEITKYIDHAHITHVTAFYGVLNTETLLFRYASAGHPAAILIRPGATPILCQAKGTILGMFDVDHYQENSIQLKRQDRLILYTDGITETKSPDGELFDTKRLETFLKDKQSLPIGKLISDLFEELDRYSQYQKATDDRSIVVIEIE